MNGFWSFVDCFSHLFAFWCCGWGVFFCKHGHKILASGIFLFKIGRFRTLRNSPKMFTNKPQYSYKLIFKLVGDISGSLRRFQGLTWIPHHETMGYSPGFSVKIGRFRTLANSNKIFTHSLWRIRETVYKSIFMYVGDVSGSLWLLPTHTEIRHPVWGGGTIF